MPIRLSSEPEQKLETMVAHGLYATPQEALDTGVAVIEFANQSLPEDEPQEIEALLHEGLASPTESEDEFWAALRDETNAMLEEHRASLNK